MKKYISAILTVIMLIFACSPFITVSAATDKYTVIKGDSLWKIAVKYQVGLDEIISANPQIKNPNLIYPGDVITIPLPDSAVSSYEAEVIRLVNEERKANGYFLF